MEKKYDENKVNIFAQKPEIFTPGDSFLWTDPHIAEQMLKAHLDPDTDSASRKPETIESIVQFNLKRLGLTAGDIVLDAGCGPGLYCERFVEYGLAVTGLDISSNSIAYAKESAAKKNLEIRYVCGNYLEMDFKDEFDAVFMIWWDFCVLNHEERNLVLKNIKRALKKGGRFVFDVSTPYMNEDAEEHSSHKELESGFFAAGPHLLIECFYQYPKYSAFLNQYVVIEDSVTRVFRLYHTNYTVDTITALLSKNGFRVENVYENLQGAPLCEKSKSLGIYAVSEGEDNDQR